MEDAGNKRTNEKVYVKKNGGYIFIQHTGINDYDRGTLIINYYVALESRSD